MESKNIGIALAIICGVALIAFIFFNNAILSWG